MTQAIKKILPLLDWYSAMGADTPLSDAPRNHYKTNDKTISFAASDVPVTPQNSATTHQPSSPDASRESKKAPVSPKAFGAISAKDHPAYTCQTLDELRQAMEKATGCDLIKAATTTVFSGGNPKADIMFVGEAPGADEDRQGEPFVGQSGQLLNIILKTIGLDRTNVYIANIIPWRPPGNRPPTPSETAYCLPFIERHIALVQPKMLVLLGGTAAKTLLKREEGILKLRGRLFSYTPPSLDADNDADSQASILTLPTFHPSYLLRSPNQKSLVWRDMLLLKKVKENNFVEAI